MQFGYAGSPISDAVYRPYVFPNGWPCGGGPGSGTYVPPAPRFYPTVPAIAGRKIKLVEYYPDGTVKRVEYAD